MALYVLTDTLILSLAVQWYNPWMIIFHIIVTHCGKLITPSYYVFCSLIVCYDENFSFSLIYSLPYTHNCKEQTLPLSQMNAIIVSCLTLLLHEKHIFPSGWQTLFTISLLYLLLVQEKNPKLKNFEKLFFFVFSVFCFFFLVFFFCFFLFFWGFFFNFPFLMATHSNKIWFWVVYGWNISHKPKRSNNTTLNYKKYGVYETTHGHDGNKSIRRTNTQKNPPEKRKKRRKIIYSTKRRAKPFLQYRH